MNNYPIISSDISSKLDNIERRISRLEYPHSSLNVLTTTINYSSLTSAATINTWYINSTNAAYRPYSPQYLIPAAKMTVFITPFLDANTSLEYRYYQTRPQGGVVGDESNYEVIVADSFSSYQSSPLTYEIDLATNFPLLIGTVGYFRLWLRTSVAIVGAYNVSTAGAVTTWEGPSAWYY